MPTLAIINATVVLPDQVLHGGAVLIRDGLIAEVADFAAAIRTTLNTEIDAGGAYLIPGLVDLHNDGLEVEVRPRPQAELPLDVAFPTYERRLVGAGVTTEFHAIAFMDQKKSNRTAGQAAHRAAFVADQSDAGECAIDHQVLHRVDVWSPDYLDDVFASAERFRVRYLSLNDHTPGQGQYRDMDKYFEMQQAYANTRGHTQPNVSETQQLIAERESAQDLRDGVYRRIAGAVSERGITVASHDDDSPEKVELMYQLGARIAEFPVTVEAARRARELGMAIVVGAPNVVRGGSQSGNLDATDLISRGLADIICADYHAPSLLPAAFRLVRDGVIDLPAAIRALTLNPAKAMGLTERGSIERGKLADLNVIRVGRSGVPHVEATFRRGRPVFSYLRGATALSLSLA